MANDDTAASLEFFLQEGPMIAASIVARTTAVALFWYDIFPAGCPLNTRIAALLPVCW